MDIYSALHADHEELRMALERLERATELDQDTSSLLERTRDLLIPHSRAEEELFYNCIRELDPDNGVVMHGYREHLEAETLLRSLQGMAAIGVEWTAATRKLREAVGHHIREEETKIFAAARELFDDEEAEQIGAAFEQAKAKLKEQGAVGNILHLVRNLIPARLRPDSEGRHARHDPESPRHRSA